MVSIEETSLVGRIHEMVGEMHAQGRMSCAEVSAVWALTMHPDLPDFFRREISSPTYPNNGIGFSDGAILPAVRASAPKR